MVVRVRLRHNVSNLPTAHHEGIGNQGPMASPGHRFCAHDRRVTWSAFSHQLVQGVPELVCLHVIGVAAKTFIAPAGIERTLLGLTQSAELRRVDVC